MELTECYYCVDIVLLLFGEKMLVLNLVFIACRICESYLPCGNKLLPLSAVENS